MAARIAGSNRAAARPRSSEVTGNVRDTIIAAGLELLRTEGHAGLTQLRIAKAAGVRQSHLTHYFPRRTDLVAALAEAAVGRITSGGEAPRSPGGSITRIAEGIARTGHMRMHLSMLMEADRDPAVRKVLVEATRPMLESVGRAMGWDAADPRAAAVLAAFWGAGMYRFLVHPGKVNGLIGKGLIGNGLIDILLELLAASVPPNAERHSRKAK